ncbi:MAG: SEL1-like repeat protein [Hyphomicrobiales bacterium]|nr:SEL1-like repeat protein [Hyphomicrobiales bacterium]
MMSNAKWGVSSPLPMEDEEPKAFGSDNPYWFQFEDCEKDLPSPRDHDPDAKALLNRHLAALRSNTRKGGNSALHELETKLAALNKTKEAETVTQAAPETAPIESEQPDSDQSNLEDRLRELSNYLNENLSRLKEQEAQAAKPALVKSDAEAVMNELSLAADKLNAVESEPATVESELKAPETEPGAVESERGTADSNPCAVDENEYGPSLHLPHKPLSAPILDRAWFEDRFAAMRSSIDGIATQVPNRRVEKLGNQFNQLMEKLEDIHADRSRAAVESGLKQLANYLEENRNWTVSHDNRIKELEDRLNHLARLVSQSSTALTATAKGLELVAKRTDPALASKTADLVTERLETRLSCLATDEKVAQLSGEVSELMLQSQDFARKTDGRLKLLQTSLDDGLNQMEEVTASKVVDPVESGWDREVDDVEAYQPQIPESHSAAQRAAQFATEHNEIEFPEDGEPIRHQIPYGEFLPDEERSNSHIGLVIAAIILLLASAAMLYLNLKDSDAARLLSNTPKIQDQLIPVHSDIAQPARIPPGNADPVAETANASAVLSMRHIAPEAELIKTLATVSDSDSNDRQAAIFGDVTAQYSIAESYLREIHDESPDETAHRLSKAARWYRRSAKGGHAPSQYRLAALYELGQGVPQNHTQAMRWYEKAASAGHAKAMHNLGVLTFNAGSQDADHAKAAFWFAKAAASGLVDSQYNLAVLNEHGLGVKKSVPGALRWYSAAALQGDAKAIEKRDALMQAYPAHAKSLAVVVPAAKRWTAVTMSIAEDYLSNPNKKNGAVNKPKAVWEKPATKQASSGDKSSAQLAHANDTVRKVQGFLIRLGFQPGKADGILGPKTMAAIRAYQEKAGLAKTGNLSDALINRMQAELPS